MKGKTNCPICGTEINTTYYTEEVENAMCLLIPDVDIVANKGLVIQNPFAPTQLIQ